ncbi:hypothetical protein Vafri_7464 [Volvox africanus]|uniref:Uncharacterized protein n=1 Tax=Volvox africanus TaxID=51714 RepID=A0A8J4F0K6_9CHLO|nr:hypothetical protein Vafri_7464 [Volvox africanus]
MHRNVYTNRKCKAVELMAVDALVAAEPLLRITERLDVPEVGSCVVWHQLHALRPGARVATALINHVPQHIVVRGDKCPGHHLSVVEGPRLVGVRTDGHVQ